jgi:hypothetical protein
MIPDKIKKDMACDRIGRKLIKYLEENMANGVIDFSLRIDSDTHFYIHPQDKDGQTLDIDWDWTKATYGSDVFGYINKGENELLNKVQNDEPSVATESASSNVAGQIPFIVAIKSIRDYFGEHDKSQFEHWAYSYLNKLLQQNIEKSNVLFNTDIDVLGNCANCGVEFHIHKQQGDPDNQVKIKPEGSKKTIRLDVCIVTSKLTEEQAILKIIEALGEEIVITPAQKEDNSKAVDIDSLAEAYANKNTVGKKSGAWWSSKKDTFKDGYLAALKEMYLKGVEIAKNNQQ